MVSVYRYRSCFDGDETHVTDMSAESTTKPLSRVYKILLVGDAGVGKSGLLLRFAEDGFMHNYNSTLGVEFKFRTVTLKGEEVKLQIWDTSGQERFRAITANYYRNIHGIMIVYDVTDQKSFKSVTGWLAEINRNADEEVNKMVVGNKSDLPDGKVDRMEAEEYAAHLGCLYMETSAKTDTNVDRAFTCIANEIHKRLGSEPVGADQVDDLRLRTDTPHGKKRCC